MAHRFKIVSDTLSSRSSPPSVLSTARSSACAYEQGVLTAEECTARGCNPGLLSRRGPKLTDAIYSMSLGLPKASSSRPLTHGL